VFQLEYFGFEEELYVVLHRKPAVCSSSCMTLGGVVGGMTFKTTSNGMEFKFF
jgi:hypothetical protein